MEAVEIAVFIFITVIVGAMVLGLILGIDAGSVYDYLKSIFFQEDNMKFQTVDADGFAKRVYDVWERCGFGQVAKNSTVYFDGTGTFDKSMLFDKYKKINLCFSIRSSSEGCGTGREDVYFNTPLTLPSVVSINCDPVLKAIRVE